MSNISADSYPSRGAQTKDSGGVPLAHPLEPTSDTTPDRPTVDPAVDLHFDLSAPRPNSSVGHETNGPGYNGLQTTLRHDAANEPGMPYGWTSAKNPE
jgi:hypothetical protein